MKADAMLWCFYPAASFVEDSSWMMPWSRRLTASSSTPIVHIGPLPFCQTPQKPRWAVGNLSGGFTFCPGPSQFGEITSTDMLEYSQCFERGVHQHVFAWRAFEASALKPDKLSGAIGMFLACFSYHHQIQRAHIPNWRASEGARHYAKSIQRALVRNAQAMVFRNFRCCQISGRSPS